MYEKQEINKFVKPRALLPDDPLLSCEFEDVEKREAILRPAGECALRHVLAALQRTRQRPSLPPDV